MNWDDQEEWEFDDRRWQICQQHLQPGEELVWYEKDIRFGPHEVKKTLRRLDDAITFLVEDAKTNQVRTVGTISFISFTPEEASWDGHGDDVDCPRG